MTVWKCHRVGNSLKYSTRDVKEEMNTKSMPLNIIHRKRQENNLILAVHVHVI